MKNACIVLRNLRKHLYVGELENLFSIFSEGGFTLDKTVILDEENEHEFSQTFLECKNFFDNIILISSEEKSAWVRARACELAKCEPSSDNMAESGQKTYLFLKAGKSGENVARQECIPFLNEKFSLKYAKTVIRAIGVPSDRLSGVLKNATEKGQGKLIVNEKEEFSDLCLKVLYDDSAPKMLVDDVVRFIAEELNDYIYAVDDTPLNVRVLEILRLRGLKLSVAESFTGGGVAKSLIEVPGASKSLFEGVVAYDNGAKQKRLGVSQFTLKRHGAVSDETAYEMAAGLLAGGDCDIALATTGIAGPQSDNTNKPVGLCYISVGTSESVYVYKYQFNGDREQITKRAINQALFLLYKQIK